ncbi:MAG: hypothetical protein GWN62_07100 [Aliifodinibius sp.]|nr:hypothetical protein [Fodinibius sp.]
MNDENNKYNERKFVDNNWAFGIALILVGILFMLDNFNLLDINLTNWWAIFILIPGLNMTVNGWRRYQYNQSQSSRNTAFWGLMLIILAFTFFFNIAWNLVFPIALIGAGIYLFFFR